MINYEIRDIMTCFMCKGHLEDRLTTFMVEVESNIIIVKNVPSQVCKQCGEVSYSHEVAEQLETIIKSLRESLTEIAIVNYKQVFVS